MLSPNIITIYTDGSLLRDNSGKTVSSGFGFWIPEINILKTFKGDI